MRWRYMYILVKSFGGEHSTITYISQCWSHERIDLRWARHFDTWFKDGLIRIQIPRLRWCTWSILQKHRLIIVKIFTWFTGWNSLATIVRSIYTGPEAVQFMSGRTSWAIFLYLVSMSGFLAWHVSQNISWKRTPGCISPVAHANSIIAVPVIPSNADLIAP